MVHEIPPRSGVAFELSRGQRLRVIDPQGEQVADLLAYNRDDVGEVLSSGRSLDYASCIYLSRRARPKCFASSTATSIRIAAASATWPRRCRRSASRPIRSRPHSTFS